MHENNTYSYTTTTHIQDAWAISWTITHLSIIIHSFIHSFRSLSYDRFIAPFKPSSPGNRSSASYIWSAKIAETGSEFHTVPLSKFKGFLPRWWSGRNLKLTTFLHLGSRVRIHAATHLLLLCDFVAYTLTNPRSVRTMDVDWCVWDEYGRRYCDRVQMTWLAISVDICLSKWQLPRKHQRDFHSQTSN